MAWRERKLSLLNNFFESKRCANIHLHYSPAYCTVNTWRCSQTQHFSLDYLSAFDETFLVVPHVLLGLTEWSSLKAANGDPVHRSKPDLFWTSPPPQMVSLHRSALMHLHLLLMRTEIMTTTPSQPSVNLFCFKSRDLFIHWGATMRHSKVPHGINVSASAKMIFLSRKHLFSFGSPMGITVQPSLS